jgi:hypothetical protein
VDKIIEYPEAYAAATRRNIIRNAATTFLRTVADAGDLVAYMHDAEYRGDSFMASLAAAYANYGKLTEKQCQAIRNSITRQAERKAAWAAENAKKNLSLVYLGEVGAKKFPLTITVKKIKQIQGVSFSYYDSGVSNLYMCEDSAGNKITYIGSSDMPKEGETAAILCTIKGHKEYNGAKQTAITRPKIVATILKE